MVKGESTVIEKWSRIWDSSSRLLAIVLPSLLALNLYDCPVAEIVRSMTISPPGYLSGLNALMPRFKRVRVMIALLRISSRSWSVPVSHYSLAPLSYQVFQSCTTPRHCRFPT